MKLRSTGKFLAVLMMTCIFSLGLLAQGVPDGNSVKTAKPTTAKQKEDTAVAQQVQKLRQQLHEQRRRIAEQQNQIQQLQRQLQESHAQPQRQTQQMGQPAK